MSQKYVSGERADMIARDFRRSGIDFAAVHAIFPGLRHFRARQPEIRVLGHLRCRLLKQFGTEEELPLFFFLWFRT
jgi:hypothetical protein